MRELEEGEKERVLLILQPPPDHKDACLRDVTDAVARIEALPSQVPRKQLDNVANKLGAVRGAINKLPPDWLCGADDFLREIERHRWTFADLANGSSSRNASWQLTGARGFAWPAFSRGSI